VRQNSVLRTRYGLAEVLLGPCSAVRVGQNSALRLSDASVIHPRLELLAGSVVIEISGLARESNVTLETKSGSVMMARTGVYRVDFLPELLKVFMGRATFRTGDRRFDVGSGRILSLPVGASERFDRRPSDELDRWSTRRTAELAETRAANAGAALELANSDNAAEFARYSAGPRGMGQRLDSPSVTIVKRPAVLPACEAGR